VMITRSGPVKRMSTKDQTKSRPKSQVLNNMADATYKVMGLASF
jgi:hypothetical protein